MLSLPLEEKSLFKSRYFSVFSNFFRNFKETTTKTVKCDTACLFIHNIYTLNDTDFNYLVI